MPRPLDQLLARAPRSLFVPIAFDLAQRMEGIDGVEAAEDPGLVAHALKQARSLLGADGIVCWFDTWLEVEAAGLTADRASATSTSRLAEPIAADVFLEAPAVRSALGVASNLAGSVGADVALIVAITGPSTLFLRMFGDDADDAARRVVEKDRSPAGLLARSVVEASLGLTRKYLELSVSAVLIVEEGNVESPVHLRAFEEIYRLAGYFNTPMVLLAKGAVTSEAAAEARKANLWLCNEPASEKIQMIPLAAFRAGGWSEQHPKPGKRVLLSQWDIDGTVANEQAVQLATSLRSTAKEKV
jgi:hypothetical protein